jgi:hypothetical protein
MLFHRLGRVTRRAEALRERKGGTYGVVVRAIKDKRGGPGWEHRERLRPPDGLK